MAFRKIRRDAKLLKLPAEAQSLIIQWLDKDGMEVCLQRIKKEFDIRSNPSSVYRAVDRWEAEEHFDGFNDEAEQQVQMEEARGGKLTPEQREEAIDRKFIAFASSKKDVKLYQQMRYLRIADRKAKGERLLAEAKIKQGAKVLRQKDKALALAERKVVLLEKKIEEAKNATENKTLSAEERARRVREILK